MFHQPRGRFWVVWGPIYSYQERNPNLVHIQLSYGGPKLENLAEISLQGKYFPSKRDMSHQPRGRFSVVRGPIYSYQERNPNLVHIQLSYDAPKLENLGEISLQGK